MKNQQKSRNQQRDCNQKRCFLRSGNICNSLSKYTSQDGYDSIQGCHCTKHIFERTASDVQVLAMIFCYHPALKDTVHQGSGEPSQNTAKEQDDDIVR